MWRFEESQQTLSSMATKNVPRNSESRIAASLRPPGYSSFGCESSAMTLEAALKQTVLGFLRCVFREGTSIVHKCLEVSSDTGSNACKNEVSWIVFWEAIISTAFEVVTHEPSRDFANTLPKRSLGLGDWHRR